MPNWKSKAMLALVRQADSGAGFQVTSPQGWEAKVETPNELWEFLTDAESFMARRAAESMAPSSGRKPRKSQRDSLVTDEPEEKYLERLFDELLRDL